MPDITKTPYAAFLEDVIEAIMENQSEKIGLCARNPDGSTLTAYYGDCNQQDKAMMAHQIYTDSIMDIVKVNAGMILDAACEEEDDEG